MGNFLKTGLFIFSLSFVFFACDPAQSADHAEEKTDSLSVKSLKKSKSSEPSKSCD